MGDKDIQRLMEIAEDALKRKWTKEEAIAFFVKAGIMDEQGNLTPPYRILETGQE
jgi:hypothetical protein